jgi:ribosomal protein S18 acetylase RimI-like enzyme
MSSEFSAENLRLLLERDRNWCAYALADLHPPYAENSHWLVAEDAVILAYHGLEPPVLFAHGDPVQVSRLFTEVPKGLYQYGLMETHLANLGDRLQRDHEKSMWRMALDEDQFPGKEGSMEVMPLGMADLQEIMALFADHPDQPDAFHGSQIASGYFFGVRQEGILRAVSGTHVVSPQAGIAALGNVFTHPTWRGRGLARAATAALVETLLKQRIPTIVLNVSKDNEPAIHIYRHLGFLPVCGYYEGVGNLS